LSFLLEHYSSLSRTQIFANQDNRRDGLHILRKDVIVDKISKIKEYICFCKTFWSDESYVYIYLTEAACLRHQVSTILFHFRRNLWKLRHAFGIAQQLL